MPSPQPFSRLSPPTTDCSVSISLPMALNRKPHKPSCLFDSIPYDKRCLFDSNHLRHCRRLVFHFRHLFSKVVLHSIQACSRPPEFAPWQNGPLPSRLADSLATHPITPVLCSYPPSCKMYVLILNPPRWNRRSRLVATWGGANRMQRDLRTLQYLATMPFLDRLELAAVSNTADRTMHDAGGGPEGQRAGGLDPPLDGPHRVHPEALRLQAGTALAG